MHKAWWLVALIVPAVAGIAYVATGDEAPPTLQAGDRLAYNVTMGERTYQWVGDVVAGEYLDADGRVESGLAITWTRDGYERTTWLDGTEVAAVAVLYDEEDQRVYQDPFIPYDEVSEFEWRGQSLRFPAEPECTLTLAGPCYLAAAGRSVGQEGTVERLMAEGLPVAAEVRWDEGNATLVGFERGPAPAPRNATPLAPLETAPPVPTPDMTGVSLAFPLDEAIQAARSAPNYVYFAQWLDANPDHYLAYGGLDAYELTGQSETGRIIQWRWSLVFTTGTQGYYVEVAKDEYRSGVLPSPLPARPEAQVIQRIPDMMELPAARDVPPMVAMGDAIARAEALAIDGVSGLPVRHLGFELRCTEDCQKMAWELEMFAEDEQRRLNPTVNTLVIPDIDLARLEVRMDGTGRVETVQSEAGSSSHRSVTPLAGATPPRTVEREAPSDPVAMAVPAATAGAIGIAFLIKFLAPLFSRVRPDALLEHPVRRRIAEAVAADPGVHLGELERRLDVPASTLKHHVRKMVEGERLHARRMGRYTCIFPEGRLPGNQVLEAAVTRSDGARQIMAALETNPGLGVRDLAELTGLNASTVSYHTRRLEEAGSVIAKRDGRVKRLRLASA